MFHFETRFVSSLKERYGRFLYTEDNSEHGDLGRGIGGFVIALDVETKRQMERKKDIDLSNKGSDLVCRISEKTKAAKDP